MSFSRNSFVLSTRAPTWLIFSVLVVMYLFCSSNYSLCRESISLYEASFNRCSLSVFSLILCYWATSSFHFASRSDNALFFSLMSPYICLSVSSRRLHSALMSSSLFSAVDVRSLCIDWLIRAKNMFRICCMVNIRGSWNLSDFKLFMYLTPFDSNLPGTFLPLASFASASASSIG